MKRLESPLELQDDLCSRVRSAVLCDPERASHGETVALSMPWNVQWRMPFYFFPLAELESLEAGPIVAV